MHSSEPSIDRIKRRYATKSLADFMMPVQNIMQDKLLTQLTSKTGIDAVDDL